ncbi:hypothetical protein SAMN04490183_1944 [Pseudomonas corrugata]|nr:hypothetical protein SAMN04490183_1944 [Pseudomonas corrugata]
MADGFGTLWEHSLLAITMAEPHCQQAMFQKGQPQEKNI